MKKIIYSIILTLAVGLMGCSEDFLDTAPKDALSPSTFWKTQKDLDLALTGCYSGFEDGGSNISRLRIR